MRISSTIKPSLAYAGIVFAVGFVLGTIRVFLVVPRIGVRWAELLEAPVMLFASFLAAKLIARRWRPSDRAQCLEIGIFGLVYMLLAEVSFVLAQGFSIPEYIASRDPVSGSVYLLSLGLFAAMPWLVTHGRGSKITTKADGPGGPVP